MENYKVFRVTERLIPHVFVYAKAFLKNKALIGVLMLVKRI
jgi:hypothetical protein